MKRRNFNLDEQVKNDLEKELQREKEIEERRRRLAEESKRKKEEREKERIEKHKKELEIQKELLKSNPIKTENLNYDNINEVFYLENYFPINKFNDENSKDILNSKKDYLFFKSKYFDKFVNSLKNDVNCVICVIPSSKKGFEISTTRLLAKDLIQQFSNIEDGTNILERIKNVKSNHLSSMYLEKRRTKQEEESTIKVNNSEKIRNKVVLLIDDISTTGTSFQVNKKLLKENNAKYVYCLALAKTKYSK